jgi:hypothetical protein
MPLRATLVLLFCLLGSTLFGQTAWTVGRTNLPGVTFGHQIAFGNGRFVVTVDANVGPGVAWSVDGQSWRLATTPLATQGSVLFAAGAFYLADVLGVWRSTDGDVWQRLYASNNVSLRGMASNGRGLLIGNALGNRRTLLYSPDFTTFRETAPLPDTDVAGVQVLKGSMASAFGRYYVQYYTTGPSTSGGLVNHVAYTVDGSAWTLVTGPLAAAGEIAAGNGRLLGLVSASTGLTTVGTVDGETFTTAPVPGGITNGGYFVFAGGRFFFAGSLQASLDGRTWAPLAAVTLPANVQMNSMAYGNGRYAAIGYAQTVDVLAVLAAPAPPIVNSTPADRTVAEGSAVSLAVTLENPSTATTFQWRRNGVALAGATGPSLEFASARIADAGSYTLEIRNAVGTIVTDPVQLTVLSAALAGRIVNLSVLTSIDEATGPESTFTVGFVVGGAGTQGTKALLVRAGGPALGRFGVASPHPDPRLELFSGTQKIAENDNWGGGSALADATTRVGAFSFGATDSKDAAVFSDTVERGDNSVRISGAAGTTGAVITEVYDATAATAFTATTPRLINVSVLKPIAAGKSLSAGFVIGGATSRTVLIRAIGPTLAGFGVTAPLANPQVAVFRQGAAAAFVSNDDWSGSAEVAATFTAVGAFALPFGSRDAALVLVLDPGEYVVQATNPGVVSGTALIEIYEAP